MSSGKFKPLQSVAEYENKIRKGLADVDQSIGTDTYQMKKLKLLACSILEVGDVESAESATKIFELLTLKKFPNDLSKASSALYLMLKAAGIEPKFMPSSKKASDLFDRSFDWRKRLIEFSDEAESKKKVSMVVNYLCTQYDIKISKETVKSLIDIFNHLIKTGQYIPGSKKELKVLKKYLETCKEYHCVCSL